MHLQITNGHQLTRRRWILQCLLTSIPGCTGQLAAASVTATRAGAGLADTDRAAVEEVGAMGGWGSAASAQAAAVMEERAQEEMAGGAEDDLAAKALEE